MPQVRKIATTLPRARERVGCVDAARSAPTPPRREPAPDLHAALLIETYGLPRAQRIASRNTRVTAPADYWRHVLAAVVAASGRDRGATAPPA